jgi:hypothetical protein
VRRLALLLLFAACSGDSGETPPPPPAPPAATPPGPPVIEAPAPDVDLSHTLPPGWDIEIHMPKAWKESARAVSEHEYQFAGEGEPGSRPEMDFGWKASDQSLETFAEQQLGRYVSPAYKLLGKGEATVAGMPAKYCVFETRKVRGIEYCFAGHGYIGFLRGYAVIDEFAKWGPVFEEAARRTRYIRR